MLDAWLGFREHSASQLLFSHCLKKFENTSQRNALYNMFGSGVKVTTTSSTMSKVKNQIVKPLTSGKSKIIPATQKTISSFLMDSFIVENIKKKERAMAAAKKKQNAEADSS